ncbi:MAG: protein adenylyltransferase SelO family protein [Sphingopyxis sp.]|uniref:protein adenylyltransferase SelO family protein n=1 Tax=Sphingopyxis sp. TaxID=1908224 RepID=UPI002ABC64C1|nr:protein adenylyltransferase SelO family protein [Sphingopyxis sp.]MDZ3831661.1 protein adenylyltransferase SelO family protein [Sphingopyxis sp.]
MNFGFDNSFYNQMEGLYAPADAAKLLAARALAFNHPLAEQLGLESARASDEKLAQLFSGFTLPAGATPIALAYAGHQFGHFSPQLGDGRALLLGEVVAPDGARFDIQLKGSGPTALGRRR